MDIKEMVVEMLQYVRRNDSFNLTSREMNEFEINLLDAVEKQEPQIRTRVFGEACKSCGFLPRGFKMNNCPNCGQRWKWEE